MRERVLYDGWYSGKPMRTEKAYGKDAYRAMRVGRGKPLDVIPENGGAYWEPGYTLKSYRGVGDMGAVAFTVTGPDGKDIVVSMDRVRPAT